MQAIVPQYVVFSRQGGNVWAKTSGIRRTKSLQGAVRSAASLPASAQAEVREWPCNVLAWIGGNFVPNGTIDASAKGANVPSYLAQRLNASRILRAFD